MKALILLVALSGSARSAVATAPDCTGANRWPASMAFVHLKNAGLVTNDGIEFDKTSVARLASEKLGKDLYRQVHRIRFTEKTGTVLEVITVSEASSAECSMGKVDVFVVSQHLGGDSKSPDSE